MDNTESTATMDVVVHKANVPLMDGESIYQFTSKLSDESRMYVEKKMLLSRDKGDYTWMVELFASSVIMSVTKVRMPTKMYALSYTRKDGMFSFGTPVEVERKTTYVAAPGVTASIATAKAKWTTAYINSLPDSSFAVVLSGGKKDKEGKTVPRSLRKLPYKDENGKVDAAHLRNGLQRLPQTDMPDSAKATARRVLEAAAKTNLPSSAAAQKPKKTNKALFGNDVSRWIQTTKSFWANVV